MGGALWHNGDMAIEAGSDVESICRKCGDVWHVEKAAPKKKTTRKTTKKAAAPVKPADKAVVEPDLDKPVRPYSFKESFEVAERIEHPKFGTGIVEAVLEPGKMEVFFPEGRRVLATAKSASKLGTLRDNRPAWLDSIKVSQTEG
jgi:hypothetical protein